VRVPLTNVANSRTIQVTVYGVNGSTNVVVPQSALIGDTNGNGTVTHPTQPNQVAGRSRG